MREPLHPLTIHSLLAEFRSFVREIDHVHI